MRPVLCVLFLVNVGRGQESCLEAVDAIWRCREREIRNSFDAVESDFAKTHGEQRDKCFIHDQTRSKVQCKFGQSSSHIWDADSNLKQRCVFCDVGMTSPKFVYFDPVIQSEEQEERRVNWKDKTCVRGTFLRLLRQSLVGCLQKKGLELAQVPQLPDYDSVAYNQGRNGLFETMKQQMITTEKQQICIATCLRPLTVRQLAFVRNCNRRCCRQRVLQCSRIQSDARNQVTCLPGTCCERCTGFRCQKPRSTRKCMQDWPLTDQLQLIDQKCQKLPQVGEGCAEKVQNISNGVCECLKQRQTSILERVMDAKMHLRLGKSQFKDAASCYREFKLKLLEEWTVDWTTEWDSAYAECWRASPSPFTLDTALLLACSLMVDTGQIQLLDQTLDMLRLLATFSDALVQRQNRFCPVSNNAQ